MDKFDVIGKRFWFFLISGIIILTGIVALSTFGLKPGVEFTSGSLMTVGFEQNTDVAGVKQTVVDLGYTGAIVQQTGAGDFLIRLPVLDDAAKRTFEDGLTAALGNLQVKSFDTVSPIIAAETLRNTIIAVVLSAIGMLIYISWAFRRMPNPFRWGVSAIAALAHDILVVVGTYAFLGGLLGWQIDLMFVAGLLTVVGYSVNGTIVIFDRIRENVRLYPAADFALVVNNSLVDTLARSLNTGMTTLFGAIALMLFVGASIQNLVVVLLVGVATGTYSAICTAAPLLVVWNKGEWGRFIGRGKVVGA
ncbi:MAG: protein translocase subunit SecF [Chloroflexota bacterium]